MGVTYISEKEMQDQRVMARRRGQLERWRVARLCKCPYQLPIPGPRKWEAITPTAYITTKEESCR